MLVVDIGVVSFSWILAYELRFGLLPATKGVPPLIEYIKVLPVIIVIWAVSLQLGGLYYQMRSDSRFHEYFRIFKTSTISILIMAAIAFFYRNFEFSRLMIGIFWMSSMISLVLSHVAVRTGLKYARRRGYNQRFVIIIGAGKLGRTLAEKFSHHPESGLKVVGILSDSPEDIGKNIHGYEVLGTIEHLKEMIKNHSIDQIFIALPRNAEVRLEKTLSLLGDETVDIKLAPDILHLMQLNAGVEDFDGIPIVSLSESPMYGWNVIFKRVFDITLSLIGLVFWAPVMVAVAIAVKLESSGPILYKQERMSLGGARFVMYKFRSMQVDAEKKSGPRWAADKDDRRTKVGEFIRKTNLDELPQIFNVLKGDMSLVGPRPERPHFVDSFKTSIPRYMFRHKVKAGMTGWAQVNGLRGNTSLEDRITHDLFYIENWSLLLDIKIILLTIWKGFVDKHAY